jgi:uncharacterized membrane protein YqjE
MRERPDINTHSSDPSRTMPSDGRSVKQIVQDIVNHISEIIRSEVRLAKTEVRQDLMDYTRAGTFIGIAAVLMFYGLGFVLLSAVYALHQVLAPWLSALIVGVSVGIAAAVLYVAGRKKLTQASIRPDKTIQSLEDNVTWFKRRTK